MTTSMNPADRAIAQRLIRDLLAAGFTISVNDGEVTTVENSTDPKVIFEAMGSTDADRLYAYKKPMKGWVYFVYGNEPGYAINDYTTNLEPWMAGVQALGDRLENDEVDFDPENIYGLPSIRQSIEEDRK